MGLNFLTRTTIMTISINNSTSGFRKWAEAQELKKRGEVCAEAGGVTVIPGPDADPGVMSPAEQPHRPWLVPGMGTL
jgi:hypothetical protein